MSSNQVDTTNVFSGDSLELFEMTFEVDNGACYSKEKVFAINSDLDAAVNDAKEALEKKYGRQSWSKLLSHKQLSVYSKYTGILD